VLAISHIKKVMLLFMILNKLLDKKKHGDY